MAFIEKKDPIVLNIRLTSKGRELLSKGQLNFSYYTVGDSEIDYGFIKNAEMKPEDVLLNNILRPADKNPDILSFITSSLSSDPYNVIDSVPSIPTPIENDVDSLGFFQITSDNTASFITDSDHVKQPDAMIYISGVTGGTSLELNQAPTYQSNVNEPSEGDLLLIRWTNPNGIDTVDTTGDTYTINKDYPFPMLFYRIEEISSGTLANNNLKIEVDRLLPNFNGSGNTLAGALVYYDYINYTGDTSYSTDDTDDALLAFLQNCQCPTVRFPFWNMSIIFTEEIVGVQTDDKKYYNFNTRGYAGFVSYIQQQAPLYKKLGVIHYTNNSVANTYAEQLFYPVDDPEKRPTLDIPLVMWHKSSGTTLGMKLRASGVKKNLIRESEAQVDQEPTSLNTTYYDLVPTDLIRSNGSYNQDDVVGKVFTDLKLFVIEDQELLFAMSYKSNRSWTLPNYGVDINANVTFGCPACTDQDYDVSAITPTTISSSDAKLYFYNFQNYQGNPEDGQVLLEILKSGATGNTQIFFNKVTGDTFITGLTKGEYITRLYDLATPDCFVEKYPEIEPPTSILEIYGEEWTQSLLNPDFYITQVNPTTIRLYESEVGDFIKNSGYTAVILTGETVNDMDFGPFSEETSSNPYYENNTLVFKQVYTVYVRDVTGTTPPMQYIGNGDATVWKDYVAVGSPFKTPFNVTSGETGGNKFIQISDYLATINQSINPIIGEIEFSLYKADAVPMVWGTSTKIYYDGSGEYEVKIRERVGTAIAAEVIKQVTL